MTARIAQRKKKNRLRPYLYLLPMLLFAAAFVYYPFVKTALFSVSTVNFMGRITGFTGFDNFAYLFSRREFTTALLNTLRLAVINVPVTAAITLALARFFSPKRPLNGVFETLIASTMAVSMSAAALTFKILLNPTVGWLNAFLGISVRWFEDRNTALYGILLLTVWMGIGFNFLVFLSAYRNLDVSVIESARLDGAGGPGLFFRIELPLISPTLLYVVCTNTILALMTSGPIMIITKGGPSRSTTTLIYLMYTTGYGSGNYSLAACVSVVAFCLTLLFTVVSLKADARRNER